MLKLTTVTALCNNIEDVVFNNVDLRDGPEEFEKTMALLSAELFRRYDMPSLEDNFNSANMRSIAAKTKS